MKHPRDYQAELRQRAERLLHKEQARDEKTIDEDNPRRLVHELQVHHIELELQNDELRQAQAETEIALARYKELYEFAQVGYLGLNKEGLVVETHPIGAALLGVKPEQISGKRLGLFIRETDRPALADMLEQVFGNAGKGSCELALESAQPQFVRIDASIIHSQPGQCRVVVWDITELKLSQLTLKERIKEQRCLFSVLELTTDDKRPVEAICKDITALLPDGLQYEEKGVARIVINGMDYHSVNWQHPVIAMQRPLTQGKQNIGFIEIGYSSTPPNQADSDRAPFLDEEKILLDSVTNQIQRMLDSRWMADTLQHAQRLEAIGQLTGGIAHDFNNLLTVMLGNAEILSEQLTNVPPRIHSMTRMLIQAAQRGGELTNQMLAFARKQALNPKSVDLNQLLEGLAELLHRALGEHIDIQFKHGIDLCAAEVDPALLENAILNLCLNARDAMPKGGLLSIETANTTLDDDAVAHQPEVKSGDYVLLTISDTGTGITEKDIEHVFEPFYTTKEQGKGTGLGLPMVYGFVMQSNGHITLHSVPGEGTTVSLYLPCTSTEPEVISQISPNPFLLKARENETILLVEDNELVRIYVETQLHTLGYRVLTASNGQQALAIVRQHDDIDLLFTDMVMPGGINGRELARSIQAIQSDIKVLYTSGYADSAGQVDAGELLLSKPYRSNELAQKLREALDKPH